MSDHKDGPRKIPLRVSLLRPNLFMGGEKRLVMTGGLLAGVLILSNMASLFTWAAGLVVFVVVLALSRKFAKKDPFLSEVFRRQMQYQAYYPPRRSVTAPPIKRVKKVLGR